MQTQNGICDDGFYDLRMPRSLHSPDSKQLRAALLHAREDAGLTQSDVAAELRKPQSFVSKYETGERQLSVIEFLNVCKALGTDPIALIQHLASRRH